MQLGLELALMGLITVFIFLVTLIFLTTLMSKIVCALEKKMAPTVTITPAVVGNGNAISDEVLKTIIVEAVRQHRANSPQHPESQYPKYRKEV